MNSLLRITKTDIQYELKTKNAKLTYNNNHIPKTDMKTTQGEFSMKSKDTSIKIDTYEARRSLNMPNMTDAAYQSAQKGEEAQSKFNSRVNSQGEALGNIESGISIADIVKQRLAQPAQYATVFLPEGGAKLTVEPGNLEMDYSPADFQYSYQFEENKFTLDYEPGSVEMVISQMPSVAIEYLGDPQYVPPSADPNYVDVD